MEVAIIALYLLVLSVLGLYGFHRGMLLFLYWKHRNHISDPARQFTTLPRVTIQLPMFNEAAVAERLIEAVSQIDYPHELIDIQVLDDSTDSTQALASAKVDELTERGFDAIYRHRINRVGFKAGALEEGLKECRGEFVLVFDADFIPNAGIINELIHHFTDPKVGMVQARWGHINRDYSLLTRVQSLMLDGHFVIEHIARNRSGRYFNFNGTAGIWRRSCIVDAGGWEHDTLTEDMDLSFRAQLRGWNFVYVPTSIAPAEIPAEMRSFKGQQFRWAKGSAQTTKKLLMTVMRAKIPLKVKIECFFHLTNNFAYVFLVVLAALQLPNMLMRQEMDRPELLLLDVPLFATTCLSIIVFYLTTHGALYGNLKDAAKRLPLMMALSIGLSVNNARAVLEGLIGVESDFVRTPKAGISATPSEWARRKYKARAGDFFTYLELAFGLYFVATIALAVITGSFISIPFLILFMVGFLYVGITSLVQEG